MEENDGELVVRLFVFGLDKAGKTTLVKYLKERRFLPQTPTLGVDVAQLVLEKVKFLTTDVGGQAHLRATWENFLDHPDVLLFVVDSADDEDRLAVARDELHRIESHPKAGEAPLLVVFNKTDLPGARSPEELERALDVDQVVARDVFAIPTSLKTGDNVQKVLNWLTTAALRQERVEVGVEEEVRRRVRVLKDNLRTLLARAKEKHQAGDLEHELVFLQSAREVAGKFFELGVRGGKGTFKRLGKRIAKLEKQLAAAAGGGGKGR
ncbi:MAG: hypothetical protein Kow0069_08130 [Promethearchaeota archaeon]